MDQKFKSTSWKPADQTVFHNKCSTITETFNTLGLKRLEIEIPETGLHSSNLYPVMHVKRQTHVNETLVKPMLFVLSFDPQNGLVRSVQQELTKQMPIQASRALGFSYQAAQRSDVVISRLVVNINDLDRAVIELMAEANRYLLLYCNPL